MKKLAPGNILAIQNTILELPNHVCGIGLTTHRTKWMAFLMRGGGKNSPSSSLLQIMHMHRYIMLYKKGP
jgi:hypothetical protein